MFNIIEYTEEYEDKWDEFVEKESINGTFLQKRKFLNYHSKDRFEDCSVIVFYKENIEAVIPACKIVENGKTVFYSHMGSTYGGIVLSKKIYKMEKLLTLIEKVEEYLKEKGFTSILYKPTMGILSNPSMDLMEYCLCHKGYKEYKEINIFINYENYSSNIISNLSKMKQRIIKKCEKSGIIVRKLETEKEIAEFHSILSKNLEKYDKKPVHSVEELLDLKNERFPNEIIFYGAFIEDKLVSGTMVFEFDKYKCAHTQYLAADPAYNKLSPMSYIYYKMAEVYYELGYKYLSWGISTEDRGQVINMGLTTNKEDYGSEHNLINIYEKTL